VGWWDDHVREKGGAGGFAAGFVLGSLAGGALTFWLMTRPG
jgi:hypothetical protein